MKQRAIIVAIACALGSPALADPKDAKPHMEAAAAAYKEGRFEDTLVELNKAYAIDPRPELHYSIGQVYVKLGRCADAILAYDSFLASKPSADRADLANQAIATCKAQQAQEPTPPPADVKPEPPPVAETTPPPPTTTAPITSSVDSPPVWYKDKLGLGLTAGGGIVTIVGLALYVGALGKADDAADADDYGKSQALYEDAQSQRTTAAVITVIGLAAVGVGAWRLWKKREEEQRGVAFVPTSDGGMITYAGGF